MSLKKIVHAPLLAALLCLTTLPVHQAAFAQAASAPAAEAAPAATPAPAAPPAATVPTVTKETIDNPYGLEALWKQGDFVARGTLVIMIIMSMGSWYIIFTKLFEQRKLLKSAKEAGENFWKSGSVKKGMETLDEGSAVITDAPVISAPANLIGIAEKGYGTLKITAKATGGHSSMPPDDLASIALAQAMVAIHANQFDRELRGPGSDMVDVLGAKAGGLTKVAVANQWLFGRSVKNKIAASPSGAAMLHTTIAPTMLQGSPKENVLPQVATGLINYRIAPWNSSADVLARAKSAVGNLPVELSWSKPPREPTPVSSTRSQGWKLVRAAAEAATPGATVTPFLVLAGTDSRSMTGVSQDVYRFAPIHFKTSETGMIHGTNEHMTLPNLERLIKFYAQLMATSAG